MSRFPQNLCVNSQCALNVCLSFQSALVVCASAGVLRPTEMSCVRTWFHFPPALSPQSARCAFSARAGCVLTSAPEWMQARYQVSSSVTGADTGIPTQILNPAAALGKFWRDTDMRETRKYGEGGNNKKELETQIEAS